MRVQELIRGILDMIDGAEQPEDDAGILIVQEPQVDDEPLVGANSEDDMRRFKQIVDLMAGHEKTDGSMSPFSNAPDEKIASIDSVTIDAGGGVNNPKHPHDLRVKDPSMYPNQQEC